MAELNYQFNESVIKELDPAGFTDLFSQVYDLTEEKNAQ